MPEFVLTAPHPLSSESQNLYEIDTIISPLNQETQSKRRRLKKLEGHEGR